MIKWQILSKEVILLEVWHFFWDSECLLYVKHNKGNLYDCTVSLSFLFLPWPFGIVICLILFAALEFLEPVWIHHWIQIHLEHYHLVQVHLELQLIVDVGQHVILHYIKKYNFSEFVFVSWLFLVNFENPFPVVFFQEMQC